MHAYTITLTFSDDVDSSLVSAWALQESAVTSNHFVNWITGQLTEALRGIHYWLQPYIHMQSQEQKETNGSA